MSKELFYKKLSDNNIILNDIQKQQFEIYKNLLIEWNTKMNLTAITDENGIYEKHFLDCILPSFNCDFNGEICDVGAGAGFPSIPLKIVYPTLNITIVEPLGKRIQFLKYLTQSLGINVTLINERSEDFVLKKREYFDVVCARAVANLTLLSELCIPLVKKGGKFIALKGQNGDCELEDANFALKELGVKLDKISRYQLNGAERINFQFVKIKNTPKLYPRHFSKIKKHPLKEK